MATLTGPPSVSTVRTGTPRRATFPEAYSSKATWATVSVEPRKEVRASISRPSTPSFISRFHCPFSCCQRKPSVPRGMRGALAVPSQTRNLKSPFSVSLVRASWLARSMRPGRSAPACSSSSTRNGASL